MTKILNLFALLLVLFTPVVAEANVFKCFYEDGSTRLSDNNCPHAVAQVDLSLKGSWMMRKPKGSRCNVYCDSHYCSSNRAKIKVFNQKDALLESLDKLPKAHYRQRSAIHHCRNCRNKRRRTRTVNACDIVVYQTVIKQFFNGVSRQIVEDLETSKAKFEAVEKSCDGPDAAKPKRETAYGELLGCKEQSAYRVGVSQARLRYHRAQREHAQLIAGSDALELKARH